MCTFFVSAFTPLPAAADEKKVLLVLWKGITDAETAFKARLAELGVQATFTEVNAEQDRAKLANAMRAFTADITAKKWDAAYTYGTSATTVAAGLIKDGFPIVFNIVFDPVGAKLVASLTEPGGSMTGVTNGVPIEDQFDTFTKLAPIKKGLVVLFNARELNSNIVEKQVSDWAAKNNVPFISKRVVPDNDSLAVALEEIKSGKVQAGAVYAGADNFLASKAQEIADAVGDKVVLFGGTETYVWRGFVAAYTPKVSDMGKTAAEQLAKVFGGQSPAKVAVILPQPRLFVSQSAAAKHAIAIPADAVLAK